MKCFICEVQISMCEFTLNPKGALEMNFEGAYGSIHDGDTGMIHICDDCFESRRHRVFAMSNYLGIEEE